MAEEEEEGEKEEVSEGNGRMMNKINEIYKKEN